MADSFGIDFTSLHRAQSLLGYPKVPNPNIKSDKDDIAHISLLNARVNRSVALAIIIVLARKKGPVFRVKILGKNFKNRRALIYLVTF